MNKSSIRKWQHTLTMILLLLATAMFSMQVQPGTIGGGNLGRCERLDSESTEVCTGKGRNRVCVREDTYCGGTGSDNSCSCEPGCETNGNCCADFEQIGRAHV